jgi:Na+/H+ antiporter NhaD/arsenite permease-like protein
MEPHAGESHAAPAASSGKAVLGAILAMIVLYGVAAANHWPQRATEMILAAEHEPHHGPVEELSTTSPNPKFVPSYFTVIPFVLLLGAIAVLPLMHVTNHWWESNLHRFYVAGLLGLITLAYYAVMYHHALDRHFLGHAVIEPSASGISWNLAWTVFQNAIFNEFVPFIVLLFTLYTICGGIRIQGDLPAHPLTNTLFLLVGGLLASIIGTTGAAMLLIRPVLETNSERHHVRHTIVFFIFIVCNCGGCLLPLGDPPLFLGYLEGVDFLWTLTLWKQWLLVNGLLVAIYFLWDHFYAYPKETKADIVADETRVRGLKFSGVWPNALLLLGVVISVALLDPSKTFPGTDWHPWLYLREIVQLALVAVSLGLGSSSVRAANKFNYSAIVEVAVLFIGIFICMQPALQILNVQGGELGIDTPRKFFWTTGALSSVLDNAPTYLVFFETAKALDPRGIQQMAGVAVDLLTAISLGAVFMGAMTYIGNGPNFMVKTIAEQSGIKMPSFFGYMLYSFAVLLPLFVITMLTL